MHLLPHDIPKQYIERGKVREIDILSSKFENGHFDVALLILSPDSKLADYQHNCETAYYFDFSDWSLSPCGVGESHSLENSSKTEELHVLFIKIEKNKKPQKNPNQFSG